MSMQAGLKAGGIGAGVMVVLALLGLIPVPFLGCLCCILVFAGMIGAGVLAANFSPAPRSTSGVAGAGAVAGLLSGLGYGVVTAVTTLVRTMLSSAGSVTSLLTPDQMQQLQQAGVDPQTFAQTFSFLSGPVGGTIIGSLCCIAMLAIGAGLGAVGGAIGAAIFKQN